MVFILRPHFCRRILAKHYTVNSQLVIIQLSFCDNILILRALLQCSFCKLTKDTISITISISLIFFRSYSIRHLS